MPEHGGGRRPGTVKYLCRQRRSPAVRGLIASEKDVSLRLDRFVRIMIVVVNPLTRNANSVFRRKGGESPNGQGGVSQGRPARRGTRSAQARFWERGRSGGGRTGSVAPILDGTGDSPLILAQKVGAAAGIRVRPSGRSTSGRKWGDSRPSQRTERLASPRVTRSARMPRCPSDCLNSGVATSWKSKAETGD